MRPSPSQGALPFQASPSTSLDAAHYISQDSLPSGQAALPGRPSLGFFVLSRHVPTSLRVTVSLLLPTHCRRRRRCKTD